MDIITLDADFLWQIVRFSCQNLGNFSFGRLWVVILFVGLCISVSCVRPLRRLFVSAHKLFSWLCRANPKCRQAISGNPGSNQAIQSMRENLVTTSQCRLRALGFSTSFEYRRFVSWTCWHSFTHNNNNNNKKLGRLRLLSWHCLMQYRSSQVFLSLYSVTQ